MVLPGHVPRYKSSDIQLLPSSTTKHQVWELYQQAASGGSMRSVSYSSFTSLWQQLLLHVVVMKPMTDLCWMCQKNSAAITRSANRPEEEKTLVWNCGREREIGEGIHIYVLYSGGWALNKKPTCTFQAIHQAELHLLEVTKERSIYRQALDTSKDSVRPVLLFFWLVLSTSTCRKGTTCFSANKSPLLV